MKTPFIFLLLLVSVAIGQNVLSTFYHSNTNFPEGWPKTTIETNNALLPPEWETNFTIADFQSYVAGLQPAYDAIQESKRAFLVSFYQGNPNFPNGWPRAIRETNNATIAPGWQTNMTVAQYQSYRASMTNAYAMIQATNKATADAALATKIASLQALFTLIQGYENEWALGSNYSNAKMVEVAKTHNATLNQMKPFLKAMYLQSLSQ